MADYRSFYDSTWLRVLDLGGEERIFTITKVEPGLVGKEKKKQPVLTFEGISKKFGCNKTNARTIAGLYGPDTDDWVGARVSLYPDVTDFGDRTDVPCIRIRPTIPRGARSPGAMRGAAKASKRRKGVRR